MYGIALILIIAAMGGAIAYIGDKLGSKVGKKKLSIFGLRPKHTSILVTIVTGVLIAAVTLGTMNAVSTDVRTALFGMEKLKSQMAFLNKEVAAKTWEIEASHAELNAKNEEYGVLTEKIEETLVRLKNITDERDRASRELENLQANYNAAEREIKSLMVTKKELDVRIKDLTGARDTLQADVESLTALAENLHRGIQNMREGTMVLRTGEVLSTVVLKAGQSGKTAAEGLTQIIYQTNQSLLNRFGISDKNLEILWVTQIDFDRAVAGLTNKNKDMIVRVSTSGNTIYGEPIIGYIDLFPNDLVYKKGQLVYSEIFSSTTNDQQAEETILVFLHKVNGTAIDNGILPDPLSGTVGTMSGAKLFDAVSKVKRHPSNNPGRDKIEIVAVAAEDISAVGPLHIDIRIRSVL